MAESSRKRGALIVFEGIDRSGKTTQSKLLYAALLKEGKKVELISFPDRTTKIGKLLDNYLKNHSEGKDELDSHVSHLLFSANRWEQSARIHELLSQGTYVILDRYAHSGAAYTMANAGFSFEWCQSCDVGLPEPDKIFFLGLQVRDAEKREGFGNERYEEPSFQQMVARSYIQVVGASKNVFFIEAKKDIASVHLHVLEGLSSLSLDAPVGKLWCDK